MRPRSLLAAFGILMLLGGPAAAQEEPPEEPPAEELPPIDEYEPTFTRTDAWVHANGSPIGNLDAEQGRFLLWDGTEPTGDQPAIYHGDNLGTVVTGANHAPRHFLTLEGVAAGDLDNVAFELFFTGWAQGTIGCQLDLSLELVIDDQVIVSQDPTGSTGFNFQQVDDTTFKTRFVLTNMWEATKLFDLEYGPDVEHDIYLNVQNFYLCNEVTWLYDSASAPSGLIVNLPNPNASYFKFDVLDPPPPLESPVSRAD